MLLVAVQRALLVGVLQHSHRMLKLALVWRLSGCREMSPVAVLACRLPPVAINFDPVIAAAR
jgi:ABC-type proline/glycine betaine transport system permease subunit